MTGLALKRQVLKAMRARKVRNDRYQRARTIRWPQDPIRGLLGEGEKTNKNEGKGLYTRCLWLAPDSRSIPFGGRKL